MRAVPTLRQLLLGVNVFVLLVPAAAVVTLRILETQLVRQTERRLIVESVLVGEIWREAVLAESGVPSESAPSIRPPGAEDARYAPFEPVLSLRRQGVEPPAPPATRFVEPQDDAAWRAGARIEPLLGRAKTFNLSAVRVLNAEGCVVSTSGADSGSCLDHLEEVRRALNGEYWAVARRRVRDEPDPPLRGIQRRSGVRVFSAVPVFSGGEVLGVVQISRTPVDPLEAILEQGLAIGFGLLACVLLTVGVSLFLSYTILKPVRRLAGSARAVARGERIEGPAAGRFAPAEVVELERSLSTMTRQLTDRAEYIAEFSTNVSHEIKTPITAIRGAVELLQESGGEMTAEQRARFLGNIDDDAARIERLVASLLELSRIQSAPERAETIDVPGFFRHLVRHYGERFALDLSRAPSAVSMNADHLESAVRNLLDNAARHGLDGPVEVAVRDRHGSLEIAVTDHGRGISDRDLPRIFDRFYTTESDSGGTGLGLAIVRAVAETRGGSVTCSTGRAGTTFTLTV